tara:strand:- start:14249 stop:14428 length:180 start_codon:yes stop_codon:yes gene_type:complete
MNEEQQEEMQEAYAKAAVELTNAQVNFIAEVLKRIIIINKEEGENNERANGNTKVPDVW